MGEEYGGGAAGKEAGVSAPVADQPSREHRADEAAKRGADREKTKGGPWQSFGDPVDDERHDARHGGAETEAAERAQDDEDRKIGGIGRREGSKAEEKDAGDEDGATTVAIGAQIGRASCRERECEYG